MSKYKTNLKGIEGLKNNLLKRTDFEEYIKINSLEVKDDLLLRNPNFNRVVKKKTKKDKIILVTNIIFILIFTTFLQNIVWILSGQEVTILSTIFVGFYMLSSSYGFSLITTFVFFILLPFSLSIFLAINIQVYFSIKFPSRKSDDNEILKQFELSTAEELRRRYSIFLIGESDHKKILRDQIDKLEEENRLLLESAIKDTNDGKVQSYTEFLTLIDSYPHDFLPAIESSFSKYQINFDLTPSKANNSQLDFFQKLTIKTTDKIMIEEGLTEYGLVDITRSTNNDLGIGTYFYSIQKNGDLILMESPYIIHYEPNNSSHYALFDSIKYKNSKNKKTIIKNKNIHDFQLFGSELVESSVQTIPNAAISQPAIKVSVIGTLFNEFLFGSSYATLNGVGKMMSSIQKQLEVLKVNITTVHRINDTRKVQLILKDQSDLELKGISIYYDFNRKMGNVKNKIQETKIQAIDEPEKKKIIEEKETNTLNSLLEAQKMLKENLITKEEFDALKLEILGSKKPKN